MSRQKSLRRCFLPSRPPKTSILVPTLHAAWPKMAGGISFRVAPVLFSSFHARVTIKDKTTEPAFKIVTRDVSQDVSHQTLRSRLRDPGLHLAGPEMETSLDGISEPVKGHELSPLETRQQTILQPLHLLPLPVCLQPPIIFSPPPITSHFRPLQCR